jgi:hypothetical protein
MEKILLSALIALSALWQSFADHDFRIDREEVKVWAERAAPGVPLRFRKFDANVLGGTPYLDACQPAIYLNATWFYDNVEYANTPDWLVTIFHEAIHTKQGGLCGYEIGAVEQSAELGALEQLAGLAWEDELARAALIYSLRRSALLAYYDITDGQLPPGIELTEDEKSTARLFANHGKEELSRQYWLGVWERITGPIYWNGWLIPGELKQCKLAVWLNNNGIYRRDERELLKWCLLEVANADQQ